MITDVDFWQMGAGHRVRIMTLINFLSKRTAFTLLFIGPGDIEAKVLSEIYGINFVYLNKDQILGFRQYGELMKKFMRDKDFGFCIIEYVHNSYFLNFLSDNIITILDAHDIISERTKSFAKSEYEHLYYQMTQKNEFDLFSFYDYVMVLCQSDLLEIKRLCPSINVLLVPHPPELNRHPVRENVKTVGFVASQYKPNIEAIIKFISEAWTSFHNEGIDLSIYGNICFELKKYSFDPSVHLMGYLNQIRDIYDQLDIVVNPVFRGAGLKIKTIEALANGLPLITTSHGARGLNDGHNKYLIIADSSNDFINSIFKLRDNLNFRTAISNSAFSYSSSNFSVDQCYKSLVTALNA